MQPKARIYKSHISGTWIRIDQGFLMTYYMYYYVKYVESYKAFFTGYWKTVFTQVLQMCHKPWIQKSYKFSTIIDVDQGFPMGYYMCCLIDYILCYSIFFPGYLYSSVKPWIQKYCKRSWNCGCTSAVYAAFKIILIRAFQRHIVCGIIWIICKVIAYSLKGMLKPCLHKYCIRATNHRCSSAVYATSRMILIRAFQQDIICGIRCIICKVIAYSSKGMLKLCLHKYCIHTTNHIYKSPVYAVCVLTLIRVSQQYIICGIVLAISKVMACSFKGSDINCNSRCYSIGWHMSQTVTPEPWRHVTVGPITWPGA